MLKNTVKACGIDTSQVIFCHPMQKNTRNWGHMPGQDYIFYVITFLNTLSLLFLSNIGNFLGL